MNNNELHKQIFEWMNANIREVSGMTIGEIAEKNFTTSSTITKVLQAYGYKGFKEFKSVVLMSYDSTQGNTEVAQISNHINAILSNPKFTEGFRGLGKRIEEANRVYIAGRGFSHMIGEFLQRLITNKFDKEVKLIEDLYQIKDEEGILFIGISLDRTSSLINDLAAKAKIKKYTNVLITKEIARFSAVKPQNFDNIFLIPNQKFYLDHHDEPLITKTSFEVGASLFLKRRK